MSKLSGLAALCALLACARPALAQDEAARAEKLFRDGGAALKRGEVDEARSLLTKSNERHTKVPGAERKPFSAQRIPLNK